MPGRGEGIPAPAPPRSLTGAPYPSHSRCSCISPPSRAGSANKPPALPAGPARPGHVRVPDPAPPAVAEGGPGPERGSLAAEPPTPGHTGGRTDGRTARPPPFPLPDRPGPGSPAARPPARAPAAPHVTGLPPQRRPRPGSGGGGLLTGKTAGRSFRVRGRGAARRFRVAEGSGAVSWAPWRGSGGGGGGSGAGGAGPGPGRGGARARAYRKRGVAVARGAARAGGRAEVVAARGGGGAGGEGARRPRARPAGPLPASRRHVTREGGRIMNIHEAP